MLELHLHVQCLMHIHKLVSYRMRHAVARGGLDLSVDRPIALGGRRTHRLGEHTPRDRRDVQEHWRPYVAHQAAGVIDFAFSSTYALVKMPSRA